MTIKEKIEADLKSALLGGDKEKVSVLRGLKSSILNTEIAQNKRQSGLDDEATTKLLFQEAKKRQEAIDIYKKGGEDERAATEQKEAEIIKNYLPQLLDAVQVGELVDKVISELGASGMQQMGQVIKEVMAKAKGQADGGSVARIVKERLNQ
jgi:uncharacterized protein YqeY